VSSFGTIRAAARGGRWAKGSVFASECADLSTRILFSFTRKDLDDMTFQGYNKRDIAVGLTIL
jgi:hypothetical protein